jgi:transcriptional regulator with XRE-family HTH domain
VGKFTLTSEQVKAARMLLRWEQKDLAARAGIHVQTLKRIELIPGDLAAWDSTIRAIRQAFESEGLTFFNGHFLGLRLRKIQGEPNARRRKSISAVASRASKPVKAVKKARAKKARVYRANRLK